MYYRRLDKHVGSLHVSQARLVSLLVRFHFFFLMLPLCLVRKLRLDFIAVQKRSPCRVRAVLAIFQLFVGGAF